MNATELTIEQLKQMVTGKKFDVENDNAELEIHFSNATIDVNIDDGLLSIISNKSSITIDLYESIESITKNTNGTYDLEFNNNLGNFNLKRK